MPELSCTIYESPLGKILLAADRGAGALAGLWFCDGRHLPGIPAECSENCSVFDQTRNWLDLYFGGARPNFSPRLKLSESPFRRRVQEILLEIPYGETRSYKDIAEQIARETGRKMSAQAVGGAVGHNAISIIVPCHRVVGSNGKLVGYAGGIFRKLALLELESGNQWADLWRK